MVWAVKEFGTPGVPPKTHDTSGSGFSVSTKVIFFLSYFFPVQWNLLERLQNIPLGGNKQMSKEVIGLVGTAELKVNSLNWLHKKPPGRMKN